MGTFDLSTELQIYSSLSVPLIIMETEITFNATYF